jgi:hypothetical protein
LLELLTFPEGNRWSVVETDRGVNLACTERFCARPGLRHKPRRDSSSAPNGFNDESVQVASPAIPSDDHAPDENVVYARDQQCSWIPS